MSSEKITKFKFEMYKMIDFAEKMCDSNHLEYSFLLHKQLKNEKPNNTPCKDEFDKYKDCYINSIEYFVKQYK
jgi:hypothetical protein